MSKFKEIILGWRVLILIAALLFSAISINPQFDSDGAAIRAIAMNSSASSAGFENPKPTIAPTQREVIIAVNDQKITDADSYLKAVENLPINSSITIETSEGYYPLKVGALTEVIELNETYNKTVQEVVQEEINGTFVNNTINKTVELKKTKTITLGPAPIGISVYDAPATNLRKGLDLQGGTRVLLQPETIQSESNLSVLIDNMKQRLNVYGLSDIIVRSANDLSGNQYVLVEIAGATEDEVRELLAKQGKFEAKIGNETVFVGGEDITFVCRTAECAGIDARRGGCSGSTGEYACTFQFAISITHDAAEKQADLTSRLDVVKDPDSTGQGYLSQDLRLFLDDKEVDTLRISEGLKGRPVTDISITGPGYGTSEQEAIYNTLENMKKLQTVLITGSLPVKLNIVQSSSVSPTLGREFLSNALLLGMMSLLAVGVFVFIRYRTLKITLPLMFTLLCEITLLLGFAALVGWNLDLAAIAGIIIAIGTGVDHQIVITDETLRGGSSNASWSWKEKLKTAFFIIMAAYVTTIVAMGPLLMAGAGLLKGFALTTMAGLTIGVFITRPAFAAIIEVLLRE